MTRQSIVDTINGLSGESGHQKIIDVYNSQKPLPRGYKLKSNDHWCAATVTAVFLMNGGCDFAECSCPRMIDKAKKLGIWEENDAYTPQIGDVCFYDWQDNGKGDDIGEADHVGIVVSVAPNGKTFIVREGNKKGKLDDREMSVNGKYIRGFILPRFGVDSDVLNDKTTNNTSNNAKPASDAKNGYKVGKTYTVSVSTALNVRKGAGTNYPLVGYNGLSADGKLHATPTGALRNGTRVTCNDIKIVGNNVWMKIPSGWICAISGNNVYVK